MNITMTKYKQLPFKRLSDLMKTAEKTVEIKGKKWQLMRIENPYSPGHKYGMRLIGPKGKNLTVFGDYEGLNKIEGILSNPRTAEGLLERTVIEGDIKGEAKPVLFLRGLDGKQYKPAPLQETRSEADKLYNVDAMREQDIPMSREERALVDTVKERIKLTGMQAGHGSNKQTLITNSNPETTGMSAGAGQEAQNSNYRS